MMGGGGGEKRGRSEACSFGSSFVFFVSRVATTPHPRLVHSRSFNSLLLQFICVDIFYSLSKCTGARRRLFERDILDLEEERKKGVELVVCSPEEGKDLFLSSPLLSFAHQPQRRTRHFINATASKKTHL